MEIIDGEMLVIWATRETEFHRDSKWVTVNGSKNSTKGTKPTKIKKAENWTLNFQKWFWTIWLLLASLVSFAFWMAVGGGIIGCSSMCCYLAWMYTAQAKEGNYAFFFSFSFYMYRNYICLIVSTLDVSVWLKFVFICNLYSSGNFVKIILLFLSTFNLTGLSCAFCFLLLIHSFLSFISFRIFLHNSWLFN